MSSTSLTARNPASVREAPVRRGTEGPPTSWVTARGPVSLARPVVVGILNVTPDSFSDGGRYIEPQAAMAHVDEMLAAGADMIDVGAESTSPGRPAPVPAEEEWRRLEPVLAALVERFPSIPFSVDTVKGVTARRALQNGAWAINDVSGLRLDPAVAVACAKAGAGLVLMHSRGSVSEMATYTHAEYADVVHEVRSELQNAAAHAQGLGVPPESIVLDPGLGFGKRPDHNLTLLKRLPELGDGTHAIMLGPSRKRFLGVVTGKRAADRDVASAAACVVGLVGGAALFRVHAVGAARDALDVAAAIGAA